MKQDNLVQKIWGLCHILRGDGISYHQYVSELTYLLFLKIAAESKFENLLPIGYRWENLYNHPFENILGYYQEMLTHLGTSAESDVIRSIYAFPTTVFSHAENLRAVIDGIAKLNWSNISDDSVGHIYEGLIEKSSQDVRSGAGQYFTPRPLVNSMVRLIRPSLGDLIQDPAAGSGGFLIAADQYIRSKNSRQAYLGMPPIYQAVEIEKNTRRICLMNTFLNGLKADVIYGDALTDDGVDLGKADVILANPPFGNKAGSKRSLRADLPFPTANKQLLFLQHIYLNLKGNGRAAVVLPDNVLFEEGAGRSIRRDLMDKCDLHTILRLPRGTFTSAGVQTNVLFFSRAKADVAATKHVWFYDLRTNMPNFGKTNQLRASHFEEFEKCFGTDPFGRSHREWGIESGRFRKYTRDEIAERDDDLNVFWLQPDAEERDEIFTKPEELVGAILTHLRTAVSEVEALSDEFSDWEISND